VWIEILPSICIRKLSYDHGKTSLRWVVPLTLTALQNKCEYGTPKTGSFEVI
jgi:hypothetical protein